MEMETPLDSSVPQAQRAFLSKLMCAGDNFLGCCSEPEEQTLRELDPEKLCLFPVCMPLASNALSCAEMQLGIHCRIKMRH